MHDTLWLAVLVLLIQGSPILLSSSSVMTGDSLLWPADVVQAEGLDATFLCQLTVTSSVGSSIEWMINRTSLHNVNVGEGLVRKEGRGNETEAIIISALPQFNGTSVTCTLYIMEPNGTVNFLESPLVTLTVQGTLEAVSDLTTKSMSSFIYLTWQQPFTLNLTTAEPDIVYLVDVVRLVNKDGSQNGESLINNISTFELYYNFFLERPDPRDVFQFTVTPRSNVEGARNGTPSQINATFSFEKPQILPTESVYTEVRFQGDQAVTVTINLNGDDLLSGPRRPETYEISLNLITRNEYEYQQEASFTVHPFICDELVNEYIMLTLNNSIIIQPNHIYNVNISASNSAGNSIIVQNLIISTHYIQDINVTSSDKKPGRINIGCKFLVNSSLAMGYLAIIYSQDRGVHYLITENSDEEYITSMLTDLNAAEYSVLLYTINKTGLPLEQPAGLPQTVLIDNQLDYSGSGDTPQPLLNVSAAILPNETNICLQCLFHDNSASACVLILFTFVTHYDDLTFLNVLKTDGVEQEAYDCIQIPNLDRIPDHVAVFA